MEFAADRAQPENVQAFANMALIGLGYQKDFLRHGLTKHGGERFYKYLFEPPASPVTRESQPPPIRDPQPPVTKEPQEISSRPVSDTVRKIIRIREQIKEEIRLAALARKRRTAKRCSG